MYLNEIVSAQKRGEGRAITSICSAHPWVLKTAMQKGGTVLIESSCNQVNQFGGYTGMTPADFSRFVKGIAAENNFPFGNIILGGDHLGPNIWQNEPADLAMQKAAGMIKDYIQAGFQKMHLDCSMKLADDPEGLLELDVSARRTARLARIAEESRMEGFPAPLYVVGTEVPSPGGVKDDEEGLEVTRVEDIQQSIESIRTAFCDEKLEQAWERVIAVVVQPGVEYGDDFILEYDPKRARSLTGFIESQQLVYEAHSTDYQTQASLHHLVRDHFAILKVGPALTFSFREAVFALALMENELFPAELRSNLIGVLEEAMIRNPQHWQKYLHGTPEQLAVKRKYSFSDRSRYYWPDPDVQKALKKLMANLNGVTLPLSLISQYMPDLYPEIQAGKIANSAGKLVSQRIQSVLDDYSFACGEGNG